VTGKNAVEAVMAILEEVVREVNSTRTPLHYTTWYSSSVGPVGGSTGGAIDTRQRIVYCAAILSLMH
jgi:hypothetical protein